MKDTKEQSPYYVTLTGSYDPQNDDDDQEAVETHRFKTNEELNAFLTGLYVGENVCTELHILEDSRSHKETGPPILYNHAFSVGFTVVTTNPADKVTQDELREGMLRRIKLLDRNNEWIEAAGAPFDTYEV